MLAEFARGFDPDRMEPGRVTASRAEALDWIGGEGLDGVMAKRLDLPYLPGQRAMLKFKSWTSYDCVVGGLYLDETGARVESLLLGLHDDGGLLHYVGRARIADPEGVMRDGFQALLGGAGFTGRAPGGRSRWTGKERVPLAVLPQRVVEVSADHVTGDYIRHGARLLRWREEKRPEDCRMDQLLPLA